MRLRVKMLVIVVVAMVTLFAILLVGATIGSAIYVQAVERRAALADVGRVQNALNEEIRRIEGVASDWSVRTETYRFMVTRNPQIIESEVGPESLANLDVHMLLFMDKSWTPVRAEFADLDLRVRAEADTAAIAAVRAATGLQRPGDPRWSRAGLLRVGDRVMIASAHAITSSDMYSPPAGTLVVGRYLDDSEVERLSALTKLEVNAFPVGSGTIPADVAAALSASEASDAPIFVPLSETQLGAYTRVADLDGKTTVILRTTIPRDIYLQGQQNMRYIEYFLACAAVISTFTVYVVMDRGALRRLSALSSQVSTIGKQGASGRVSVSGGDEIGALAYGINTMMDAIESSEDELRHARDELEERVRVRTAELLASEARYRHLIEQMADAVFAVGLDGRIILANERASEMCGREPADMVGVLLESLLSGSASKEVQGHIDRRHAAHNPWTMEASIGGPPGGAAIPVELRASPLLDEAGEVIGTQWIARDIAERKRFEEELVRLASHDHLTGLHNRRFFESALDAELDKMRHGEGQGAILWLDLNDFKDVNDSLGHKAGDEVLLELGSLLRRQLRGSEVLARLGGDEFAVLVPDVDAEEAQALANRVLASINSYVYAIRGHALRLNASMGLVTYPQNGTTVEDLVEKADAAMYAAKEGGESRARAHPFDDSDHTHRVERARWHERITSALSQGRFVAYAQPVLHVKSSSIVRFELLARMVGEDGSIILPGQFLPTAERTGLVRDIDRMMVRKAVRIIRANPDETFGIEVNLSGKAFTDRGFLPEIAGLLADSGVDPGRLGFEITETAAIADVVRAQEFIRTLKDLGCRFSLDDFGSGFSSFYYLKHLPIDCLKVDGSFIRGLPDDEQDWHLVRGMAEMCRGLGVSIAAEYVESPEIMDAVSELGVDFAQGYYIGRPAPVDEALGLRTLFTEELPV